MLKQCQVRISDEQTWAQKKENGAIRRPRNSRIEIYIVVCRDKKRSHRLKKGVYGGEIRYQLRIQRYIEWDVTLTRKLAKFRVKSGLHFKNLCYNIGKIIYFFYLFFFFFLFVCLFFCCCFFFFFFFFFCLFVCCCFFFFFVFFFFFFVFCFFLFVCCFFFLFFVCFFFFFVFFFGGGVGRGVLL